MLYELDVLETQQIADLAQDARKVRDRLLEKVPEARLGEPAPARGEHNPNSTLALNGLLDGEPAVVALRQAITALPREIREKVWAVARTGRGDAGIENLSETISSASALTDEAITADLMEDPDLHDHLRKGLYELGALRPSGAPDR